MCRGCLVETSVLWWVGSSVPVFSAADVAVLGFLFEEIGVLRDAVSAGGLGEGGYFVGVVSVGEGFAGVVSGQGGGDPR